MVIQKSIEAEERAVAPFIFVHPYRVRLTKHHKEITLIYPNYDVGNAEKRTLSLMADMYDTSLYIILFKRKGTLSIFVYFFYCLSPLLI